MAKQKTLFEQLKSAEHQESIVEKTFFSGKVFRSIFITFMIILSGILFPNQRAINENGEDVRQVNIGVLWMNETIKAEFPFAIKRPESEIEQERKTIISSSPMICTESINAMLETEARISAIIQICEGRLQKSDILSEYINATFSDLSQQDKSLVGQILNKSKENVIQVFYERKPMLSGALISR